MLKEALQYLVGLAGPKTVEVEGFTYSDSRLQLISEPKAAPLQVTTLSAIVEYLQSGFDQGFGNFEQSEVVVHVASPTKVNVVSVLFEDGEREIYMTATPVPVTFQYGQYYNVENFIIALQSCFENAEDRAKILKLVGNLKDEQVRTVGDDGVTQQVTAKTGIAAVENVIVPNPVSLQPYRTFIEVEQPVSNFVFRIRKGNQGPECALFEADGGYWRINAMTEIQSHLVEELGEDFKVIS